MLILTRKIGESIIIGENIRLVVLEVRGKQVRLGIEAPAQILVLREEILLRLTEENLRAAKFRHQDLEQIAKTLGKKIAVPAQEKPSRLPSPLVTVDNKEIGEISVPENQILSFPNGLPGFEEFHRFVLVQHQADSPFFILQCLDDPPLALVVADPAVLVPEFEPRNFTSALKDLKADSLEELQTLVILTIPRDHPQDMTANLMSPILINPRMRLGKQMVIEKPQFSHQYRVVPDGTVPPPNPQNHSGGNNMLPGSGSANTVRQSLEPFSRKNH